MRELFAQVTSNEFNVPKGDLSNDAVQTVLQIVFALIGAVAVIILMLAALKYITSRGDPQAVAKAKNTIVYAAIGLVISVSAFTIVGFVIKSVK